MPTKEKDRFARGYSPHIHRFVLPRSLGNAQAFTALVGANAGDSHIPENTF